jgi:hypothetical protein
MMTKALASAASIIAFSAMSGMAHAKTAMHERTDKVKRLSSLLQMQNEPPDSFAAMSSRVPENNPHVYHGGPKSND